MACELGVRRATNLEKLMTGRGERRETETHISFFSSCLSFFFFQKRHKNKQRKAGKKRGGGFMTISVHGLFHVPVQARACVSTPKGGAQIFGPFPTIFFLFCFFVPLFFRERMSVFDHVTVFYRKVPYANPSQSLWSSKRMFVQRFFLPFILSFFFSMHA